MKPMKLADLGKWAAKFGYERISVEERRAERLDGEQKYRDRQPPWHPVSGWQFGTRTEADFPLGYAKEAASLAA